MIHSRASGWSSGLNLVLTILVKISALVGTQLASVLYCRDRDLHKDGPKQIMSVEIEQHLSIGRYPTTTKARKIHANDSPEFVSPP